VATIERQQNLQSVDTEGCCVTRIRRSKTISSSKQAPAEAATVTVAGVATVVETVKQIRITTTQPSHRKKQ
jgi:hypothetical protein